MKGITSPSRMLVSVVSFRNCLLKVRLPRWSLEMRIPVQVIFV